MTRFMYDSITAADLPVDSQIVAGYCDGLYRWSDADWARFPNAVKVRIAVNWTTNDGHVGDVEQGDMTPTTALAWVRMRRRSGVEPTLYATWGTISSIAQVFDGAGEPEPHYWVAQYDNVAVLPPGVVAKQFANDTFTGHHYDLSIVADYWPGVDPPRGDDMFSDQDRLDLDTLAWRVDAIFNNYDTIAGGPEKGKPNALRAELEEIKTKTYATQADVDSEGQVVNAIKNELDTIKSLPGGEPIAARIEAALKQA